MSCPECIPAHHPIMIADWNPSFFRWIMGFTKMKRSEKWASYVPHCRMFRLKCLFVRGQFIGSFYHRPLWLIQMLKIHPVLFVLDSWEFFVEVKLLTALPRRKSHSIRLWKIQSFISMYVVFYVITQWHCHWSLSVSLVLLSIAVADQFRKQFTQREGQSDMQSKTEMLSTWSGWFYGERKIPV